MRIEPSQIHVREGVEVSQESWVVTMAMKRGVEHAFLLIEGINEHDEDVLLRADLFLDGDMPIFNMFNMPIAGTALICLKPASMKDLIMLQRRSEWFGQSWEVTHQEASRLIQNIEANRDESSKIKYALGGDGSIHRGSHSSAITHNCASWCLDRLKSIEIDAHPGGWRTSFVVRPSAVIEALEEESANKGMCSIM